MDTPTNHRFPQGKQNWFITLIVWINGVTLLLWVISFYYIFSAVILEGFRHAWLIYQNALFHADSEYFKQSRIAALLTLLNLLIWIAPALYIFMLNRLWHSSIAKAKRRQIFLSAVLLFSYPYGTLLHSVVFYLLWRQAKTAAGE